MMPADAVDSPEAYRRYRVEEARRRSILLGTGCRLYPFSAAVWRGDWPRHAETGRDVDDPHRIGTNGGSRRRASR